MEDILQFKELNQYKNSNLPINIFLNTPENNATCILHNHWHDSFEIIYLLKGDAVFNIGNTEYAVTPGDILIVNPKVFHTGYSVNNAESSFYAFVFDSRILAGNPLDPVHSKLIQPLIDNRILIPGKIPKDQPDYSYLKTILKRIIDELENKETGFEIIVKSQLLTFFALLLRTYSTLPQSIDYDNMFNKYSDSFNELISYLETNFPDKITIETASAIMHLSPFHFCRVFKKITGSTFNDFLNFYRVNKAEDILKTTDIPITEVAVMSGFYDISYFDRVFKKFKKYTPKNCRNLYKK